MKPLNRILFVIGLVLLFGGLDLAILLSHTSRWVGIVFILAGIGILTIAVKRIERLPVTNKIVDNLTETKTPMPAMGMDSLKCPLNVNIWTVFEARLSTLLFVTGNLSIRLTAIVRIPIPARMNTIPTQRLVWLRSIARSRPPKSRTSPMTKRIRLRGFMLFLKSVVLVHFQG